MHGQIFETEAQKALKSSLVQFGAKEHFFKAGILHLAKGVRMVTRHPNHLSAGRDHSECSL